MNSFKTGEFWGHVDPLGMDLKDASTQFPFLAELTSKGRKEQLRPMYRALLKGV